MVLIPFPWIKNPFCVDSSLIYGPRNSNINKLAAAKKINSKVREKKGGTFFLIELTLSPENLPKKDSIFCKIKQRICRWINWKKLTHEFIFSQVVINMCNIRSFLRFINCMMNSCCSCLQK